ncbi:MAG: DNA mismatch repair protein MutS [Spirochaetales bacterium]|nr:DNA mismatch repair protein MutS [Spirochaetales bacterium]
MAREITPLMQQYLSVKEKYREEVLFFRLGDFYEMFDDDAREVSRLLNLTLTHRNDSPMCGIPFHAAKNYIKRLLAAGKKIAVCEQMELPSSTNQIVRREVIQVITPATVVEQEFLEGGSFNYLLAVFGACCAYCDISTGDLRLRALDASDPVNALSTVLQQIRPSEILVCDDEYYLKPDLRAVLDACPCMIDKLPAQYFSVKDGYSLLCATAGTKSLEAFGLGGNEKTIGPAGAILKYVRDTAKPVSTGYFNISVVDELAYMRIDEATRRNLELTENIQDRTRRYSLLESINRTVTAQGQRLLQSWLGFPLVRIEEINFRQDWTGYFVSNPDELHRVRDILRSCLDIQRLANRVSLKRSIPRDLVGIKQTLGCLFSILSIAPERYASILPPGLDNAALGELSALMDAIDRSISEECNGPFVSGAVIVDGYDSQLDGYREMVRHSSELFDGYLQKIKAETGITTVKIVNSRVCGYVLEVSRSQTSKVPDYFIRRQTLVNGERYTTTELSELEAGSQEAERLAEERERKLYEEILNRTAAINLQLNDTGRFISVLDCFQSFAAKALEAGYCRPSVVSDDVLRITDGRHPVVEDHLEPGAFVPNDTMMDERFFLITGPNMAGKSTYLRQTALIVLLAHMGSFVPAKSAEIGLTDSIFCRVGASDNLAKGESTFLVEMQEAAFILRSCTRRSLVIMDEIGRGTSAQEGMSIAWSIIRYLLNKGPKTLFATHFHELAGMDTTGMALYTLAVRESPKSVTFLRKLVPGSASSSYALHVARMAGIPQSVIKDAAAFGRKHFADYGGAVSDTLFCAEETSGGDDFEENRIKWVKSREIIDEILSFNPDASTPIQAMIEIEKLRQMAKALE